LSPESRRGEEGGDYLDCEIDVQAPDRAVLRVANGQYPGRPDLGPSAQELLYAASDPLEYGKRLFESLLPSGSELRSGYREGLAIARRENRRLRIHLSIDPALQQLRWERLYDERRGIALARSREVVLSRQALTSAAVAEPITGRLKLLVAIANPTNLGTYGLPAIDPASSRQIIEEAMRKSPRIDAEFLDQPVTAVKLSDRLIRGKFHAVHLLAHGSMQPEWTSAKIALEKPDGTADFVDESLFQTIFEGNRELRLVMLVACHGGMQSTTDPFSGLGPAIVKQGIPAVVAMRQRISFETARILAEQFYLHLSGHGWVDRAANEARQQLFLSIRESDEWSTPILFLRSPDGPLWKSQTALVTAEPGGGISWPAIVDSINADLFVPLLGPEVTHGLLLSGKEIADHWIAGYDGFPLDKRSDLPAVAQFVEAREEKLFPHARLSKILARNLLDREDMTWGQPSEPPVSAVIDQISHFYFGRDADEPHRLLAELPISTYVTTNCDNLMTAALRWKGRKPNRQACLWRKELQIPAGYEDLSGSLEEPLVYHMYGRDDAPASLVLTEDNYLDYLGALAREEHRLPGLLRTKLTESMLLFLGYDVRRLDCRVLLRGVVASLRDIGRGRIAVLQVDPSTDPPRGDELRYYLQQSFSGVKTKVYWGSVRGFLSELRQRRERR
jgi:CHAT domain-containing protein/SIR2-like protein